jgi:integrase
MVIIILVTNVTISNYLNNVQQMNKATALEYHKRLRSFATFVMERYGYRSVDILTQKLTKNSRIDPYEVLSSYVAYLNRKETFSPLTIKQRVVTAKNFLEFYDIEISPRRFKLKIKLPKVVRRNKEALTKEDVIDILNACSDIKLKTYVMLLVSTGLRATEALSTRVCDYNLEMNPPKVFVRGEYTKTRSDRIVFLTQEVVKQIKNWLEFKYRTRRVVRYDKVTTKLKAEYRTPIRNDKDLMFSVSTSTKGYAFVSPNSLYTELREVFGKTLDRIGRGEREDS